jgi:hypothetical protein
MRTLYNTDKGSPAGDRKVCRVTSRRASSTRATLLLEHSPTPNAHTYTQCCLQRIRSMIACVHSYKRDGVYNREQDKQQLPFTLYTHPSLFSSSSIAQRCVMISSSGQALSSLLPLRASGHFTLSRCSIPLPSSYVKSLACLLLSHA